MIGPKFPKVLDRRFISNESVNKSIKKLTLISIGSTIILFIAIILTLAMIYDTFSNSAKDRITSITQEISTSLTKMLNADYQILQTISSFSHDAKSFKASMGSYYENDLNDLNIITYWDLDLDSISLGKNGLFSTKAEYAHILPRTLTQIAINSNEPQISDPYISAVLGVPVIFSVIPTYDENNKVSGAVSAEKPLIFLKDILSQFAQNVDNYDVFLINSDGDAVVGTVDDEISSINDSNGLPWHLSSNDKNKIKDFLNDNSVFTTQFISEDGDYSITLHYLYFFDLCVISLAKITVDASQIHSSIWELTTNIMLFVTFIITISMIVLYKLKNKIKENFENFMRLAYYDTKTGAYNKLKLIEVLDTLPKKKNIYALVGFNVKDFSYINQSSGEVIADKLLAIIAKKAYESENIYFVSRVDKDQFYFIYKCKQENLEEKKKVLEKIIYTLMDDICDEFEQNYFSLPINFYAAIAFSSPKDEDGQKILKAVELTQKEHKSSYLNQVSFYDETFFKRKSELKNIEFFMRNALANNEFKVYLQPKVNIHTGKLSSCEALVRWFKEDGTSIPPSKFIPLFEQNGFCVELDFYMFEKTCQIIRDWIDRNIEPIVISINQSKLLFFQKNYADRLESIIKKYNVPGKYLCLEILEDIYSKNLNEINYHIKKIHDLGIKVSLDDFGSCYSSLNILSSLQIDEIKFDRKFMMTSDESTLDKNCFILTKLTKIAHTFDIATVVEGVENKKVFDLLRTIHCEEAQGYYLSRPIPLQEFEKKYLIGDRKVFL